MHPRLLLLGVGIFVLAAGLVGRAAVGQVADADRAQLLEGVRQITAPGLPGSVAVWGERAFPVVTGKGDGGAAVVIGAATLGKGRIVALGHDGYFAKENLEKADTGRLIRNAVRWTSGGKANPRVLTVGLPETLGFLRMEGMDAAEYAGKLDADVVILIHSGIGAVNGKALREYVERGGGLVAASTGWGWAQITGKPIIEHPLSAVTSAAGLAWTSGTVDRTVPAGFEATAPPRFAHAGLALKALTSREKLTPAETSQAAASILLAARSAPPGDASFTPLLKELRAASGASPVPAEKAPVTTAQPLQRVALALDLEDAMRQPAAAVRAHPAAADFPGAVPAAAARVTRKVSIDTRTPGWHSLGLYAAPGEKILATLPDGSTAAGRLRLRIGAHTDELWHLDAWKRAPSISREFGAERGTITAANAFGGLVYLVVPPNLNAGRLEVTVAGAVEAPLFTLGETSVEEWKRTLRQHPAPWAELVGKRVAFTVPSTHIRNLEDPQALMETWDKIVAAQEHLVGLSGRERPERIVADRQISAGYMHSGYPIMVPIDSSTVLALDLQRLKAEGSWGHFHELGHNLQSGEWTFGGTGEVTNNVLAMYVYPKILGLRFDGGHPAIRDRAARMERVRKYVESGAPFEKWKSDPFLALTMYIQLVEGFGWEPFEKVFAGYRTLAPRDRPRTDEQKRDQWLVRVSRATGKNLGPFFQAWGVPTSEGARNSVKDLPAWMPPDMPRSTAAAP